MAVISLFDQLGIAPQKPGSLLIVIFPGHVIVGGVVSSTVTSSELLLVHPFASVNVYVIVLAPDIPVESKL